MKYRKGLCPICNREIITDQLWIDPPLKGFKSQDHGCGEENTLLTFNVPADDLFRDIDLEVEL